MKFSDRMVVCLKGAYGATFHKRYMLGKMGYLYDDLTEAFANDINYLKFDPENIRMCRSVNMHCLQGIKSFADQDYKNAYRIFEAIDDKRFPEVNFCRAMCMLYGKGTKKNVNRAFEIVKDNMDRSSCCMQLTARCYIEGCGVKKNKKKAYELISKLISEQTNDIEEDYLLPDLLFFCGEYEMEMEKDTLAIEHLKKAAVDMDYGPAYYSLGRYYFEEDREKAKMYMDKARALKVSVAAKYYSEERSQIADESIDGGVIETLFNKTDEISHISDNAVNIYDNLKSLSRKQRKIDQQELDEKLNKGEHDSKINKIKYKVEKKVNEAKGSKQIRKADRKIWFGGKIENIEKKLRKEQ